MRQFDSSCSDYKYEPQMKVSLDEMRPKTKPRTEARGFVGDRSPVGPWRRRRPRLSGSRHPWAGDRAGTDQIAADAHRAAGNDRGG